MTEKNGEGKIADLLFNFTSLWAESTDDKLMILILFFPEKKSS